MQRVESFTYDVDINGMINKLFDDQYQIENKPSRKQKLDDAYEDNPQEDGMMKRRKVSSERVLKIAHSLPPTPRKPDLTPEELDSKIRLTASNIFTAHAADLKYFVLGKDNQGNTIGSWRYELYSGYFTVKNGIIFFSSYHDTLNLTGGIAERLRIAIDRIFKSPRQELYYSILQEDEYETIGCWQYGKHDGCFIATKKMTPSLREHVRVHICKDNGSTNFIRG